MTILRAVLDELHKMFLADARMSLALIGVVALAAVLQAAVPGLLAGAVLLLGCLGVLVEGVRRTARRR